MNHASAISPLRHESLQGLNCGIRHGIFNRYGGVSSPPFGTLNLSYNVGDHPGSVRRNREKIKENLSIKTLVSGGQVHGTDILIVDEKPVQDQEIPGYDALITNVPGTALLVLLADCQSVMLVDPKQKAVANIHCGWRGNAADIIGLTVKKMEERFLCRPADLLALISPSLGPCCAEFKNWRRELPSSFAGYQQRPDYFDLRAVSRDQLSCAGLSPPNIQSFSICSKCNPEWFSYRREQETGRFGTVILLEE